MTNDEYNVWAKRLFVCFPSLEDWLQKTTSPIETQKVWRRCLEPYSLAECMQVVDEWSTGAREPFAAYERDHVHLRVRARIEQDRDKQRRRDDTQQLVSPYGRRGQQGSPVSLMSTMDGSTRAAVEEGGKQHKRLLDGEIDRFEYEQLREAILIKHGITGGCA